YIFKNCRVYHAGAHDFEPAGIFANPASGTAAQYTAYIYLCGRLGKRKEARPEPHRRIGTEYLTKKCLKNTFQIAECNIFIHHKPLDLMEHGAMSDICIAPVHLSGGDKPHRGLPLFHPPH